MVTEIFKWGVSMVKTNSNLIAAMLMAGFTAACGQNAAAVENSAESTAETEIFDGNATAPVAEAVNIGAAETAAPAPASTATVEALPLRQGHYVRAETPCNRASRADLVALVSRTGMNLSCTFKKIEKTGATTYRVTSECSDGGAAWGREEGFETSTDIYDIPNDTSFTVKYEGGSESSARYCPQVNTDEM